jgi:tetratricopeptide (TPR) repeat protein
MRALELDPGLPEAHYAYAMALTVEYDWTGAEREFRRAIRLDPRFPESHSKLAVAVLIPARRFEEAILEAKRAVDLAPNDPFQRWTLAYVLYQSRHFDIILGQLGRYSNAPMANDSMVRLMTGAVKGMALIGAGRPAEAVAATKEAALATPPPNALAAYFYATRGVRGNALALLGRRREAEQIVREMQEANGPGAQPCNIATVYAALGDREAAMGQLDRCYEVKAPGLPFIATDVRYDSLRSDPRFRSLLTKIGLR